MRRCWRRISRSAISALDLIGQARSFYTYAGEIEGKGRDEDALAYLRDAGGYRNVLLVEQPNGDFAQTMVRQLLYSAFAHPYFEALTRSKDATLAAIAAKAVKEMAYHLRHSAEWIIRLGDGTDESHRRAQTCARRTLALYRRIVRDRSDRARADRGRDRGRSARHPRALVEDARRGVRGCDADAARATATCRAAAAAAATASISASS